MHPQNCFYFFSSPSILHPKVCENYQNRGCWEYPLSYLTNCIFLNHTLRSFISWWALQSRGRSPCALPIQPHLTGRFWWWLKQLGTKMWGAENTGYFFSSIPKFYSANVMKENLKTNKQLISFNCSSYAHLGVPNECFTGTNESYFTLLTRLLSR